MGTQTRQESESRAAARPQPLGTCSSGPQLEQALAEMPDDVASWHGAVLPACSSASRKLFLTIRGLFQKIGPVSVLIDEYDKPILDNILDIKKAEEIRFALHSFYSTLKRCNDFIYFLFITDISKFSKVSIFSSLNNLEDIFIDEDFSSIVGYTQDELEYYFSYWIDYISSIKNISSDQLLLQMKDYYDDFSFDGHLKLYNPFSILNFFKSKDRF